MIHAMIDSVTTRNIVGFECGNRALFDTRHASDPLWVFLDFNIINYRVIKADFLLRPRDFYIDDRGNLEERDA